MTSVLPPTLSDELAELRRRIDRLENSSRVPSISRRGVQADATDGGFLLGAAEKIDAPLDAPADPGPTINIRTTATGRILLHYGAGLSTGQSGPSVVRVRPINTGPDGPLDLDEWLYIDADGQVPYAHASTARMVEVPPSTDYEISLRYSKDAGITAAGFTFPYLVGWPL
jgi:hypothetical protein